MVVEESGTYPLEVLALAMMMVIGINLLHLVVGVGEMDSMHQSLIHRFHLREREIHLYSAKEGVEVETSLVLVVAVVVVGLEELEMEQEVRYQMMAEGKEILVGVVLVVESHLQTVGAGELLVGKQEGEGQEIPHQ